MWKYNMTRGTIWTTKSINELNEWETYYEGMTCGCMKVLLLSAFVDSNDVRKYTYLKVFDRVRENRTYITIDVHNTTYYVELDELRTGNQNALDKYVDSISLYDLNNIVSSAKEYFSLNKQKTKQPKTYKPIEEVDNKPTQQRIHKFGIDIYVVESEDVTISKSKKLLLSNSAKEDIIYNSKTDEDIIALSNKYQIYPLKAIREIRNRLVYQHKQKEG